MRRNDYTGVEQTCPLINEVRDFIEDFEWDEEFKERAKEACQLLEKIRQMNSDLRDFGNKQARDLEEAEVERDYYHKRADDFESEIKYLEKEFKESK